MVTISPQRSSARALLDHLASEQRRVLSSWRGVILLRRATFDIPPHERRWEQLVADDRDLTPLLRQMQRRGDIQPIAGLPRIYEVTVPYARQGFIDEREILFEMHPYAVVSHRSAFEFHGLTDDLSNLLTVTVSADTRGGLLPIGTRASDWEGVELPATRQPKAILGRSVSWLRTKPERFFGFAEYEPLGYPLRYTTLERTLIDGVQEPDLCGGIATVLTAWAAARDRIDVDALVYAVDRLDIGVLRQRVGYLLEQIGRTHPALDRWQSQAKRGGSSRLIGSQPFASTFDERWSLSLNGPVELLH